MVKSICVGDHVITAKSLYGVPKGTEATVAEIVWVDFEATYDIKFVVGLNFPSYVYDMYDLSKDEKWGYYNTEIEKKIEEK